MRNRLVNPLVRALARTPAHRFLGRHLIVLGYTGRRTGRRYELPVMSVRTGEDLVVLSGNHEKKTWWRNFDAAPREVTVRSRGRVERRSARRLSPGDAGYAEAVDAYRGEFRHVPEDPATPVIVLAPASAAEPVPPPGEPRPRA